MFRRDQLCPGPRECPEALNENPQPGADAPRCEGCPVTLLDDYLASGLGQVLLSVIDLDFALQAGVTVSLAEITYREFLLLRLLSEERNRHNEEVMKKATHHGR